ncbi:FtsH protease activity modulator HflK [Mucisphaera sp.]|uniref:FtsH protease activity modulator HflK n=1 Tax=Mucisphaera sp. TaxID=2913024 RepID=UPI003D0E9A0A
MARTPGGFGNQPDIDPAEVLQLLWKRYGAGFTPIFILIVLVGVGIWTSIYTVATEGRAVVKRFGEVSRVADPGLNFKLPFFIETATFVPTERVQKEEFGFTTTNIGQRSSFEKTAADLDVSLMLTGDLNVIDVEWVVQYRITDPVKYLHSVRAPVETLRDISEAAMRRIVGNRIGADALTVGRVSIANRMQEDLSTALEAYDIGLTITAVELQDVLPPERVKPAFDDVNAAQQERERSINEAERSRNQILARAEGEAQQLIAQAEGYKAERVNVARGETDRYLALLEAYQSNPQVTRQRMYLEMIDRVLPEVGKIFVIESGQAGPLPLLNLNPEAGNPVTGGAR